MGVPALTRRCSTPPADPLAGGVKGLTARFDVLLLTVPALQPDGPATPREPRINN
jgi:hypothetical protein